MLFYCTFSIKLVILGTFQNVVTIIITYYLVDAHVIYVLDVMFLASMRKRYSEHAHVIYVLEVIVFFSRCLGMLIQKVDDRIYVREKIDWMCRHSSMSIPINRLGLAQGIGLVSCH